MSMESFPERGQDHEFKQGTTPRDLYPTPDDWITIQGGKPRVFRNPYNPNTPWEVVHVYEDQTDHDRRFASGAIVQTRFRDGQIPFRHLSIPVFETDEDTGIRGRQIGTKGVAIPAFMDRNVHGDACEETSGAQGSDRGYTRIKSQPAYEKRIAEYRAGGWQEVRYGVAKDGSLQLIPLAQIRDPRPLESTSETAKRLRKPSV